ncbi:MAG: UDP-N-acetylglucosamine 4-epimerase, partial [bacterium]
GNVYNLVKSVASNKFLMVGDGRNRKSLAYVDNVAAFLLECLSLPPGRHMFNYADKPDFTMNELVALLRGLAGRKPAPGPRLPRTVGLLGGHAADAASRLTGRTFPISAVRVRKFTENTIFKSDKLPELNFTPPVALRDGMERFFRAEFGGG